MRPARVFPGQGLFHCLLPLLKLRRLCRMPAKISASACTEIGWHAVPTRMQKKWRKHQPAHGRFSSSQRKEKVVLAAWTR